ncbi:hypothetical protein Taro_030367 [Colocasia esculenta]|uniref:Uncharacterized protein n=1 Tax=Colocasia esculenta TaxID=4460 RepID=A0A843VVZ3_COLES|nr:hypothetical protein [Colocasia esculenta]
MGDLLKKTNRLLSVYSCCLTGLLARSYRFLAFHVHPFWVQLSYFLFLAFMGSLALVTIKPSVPSFKPKYVDMLYLSTSALTVSGLATVEMEVLSQSHVVVYTLLMLLGGEVWVSLLGILVRLPKYRRPTAEADGRVDPLGIELAGLTGRTALAHEHGGASATEPNGHSVVVVPEDAALGFLDSKDIRYRCLRVMACVVFFYLLLIHVSGSLFIFLYLILVPSAKGVLKGKSIRILPFAISITVSSFANGGLIPTNENMIVFKKNAGLLLLMIPQILAGNTMFPVFLRLVVWALRRLTWREEFEHMMQSPRKVGYPHLMGTTKTVFLAATIALFLATQISLFCALEWKTDVLAGLSWFQKVVAASFQTVNSRHAGEAAFDLSTVSTGMLVLFIVMMYLPAYVHFWPFKDGSAVSEKPDMERKKRSRSVMDNVILSQLSYLAIFVIILCIIERKKMVEDPVNFSLLNIIFEITRQYTNVHEITMCVEFCSAYGNVGFSLGYSCARQITPDASCKDAWYGFSGRFSSGGKLLIVLVMLFGRLKRHHLGGGKAWILS